MDEKWGKRLQYRLRIVDFLPQGQAATSNNAANNVMSTPPLLGHLVWGKRIRGVSTLVLSRKINTASAMIATALGGKDSQKSTHLKEYHWYKYLQLEKEWPWPAQLRCGLREGWSRSGP